MTMKIPARFILANILFCTGSVCFAQTTLEVSPAARAALGISVTSVRAANSFSGASASGIVIAPLGQSHSVTSPFSGVLLQPLVVPGMQVNENDEVALLHSRDYSSAYAELETKRLTAEHDAHLAEKAEQLRKLGLRSSQETEEAQHEAKAAKLAFDAVDRQLASVVAANGAGRYKLIAPVAGIVTHISAEAGRMVEASMPILTIFSGKAYWARAQIPERLVDLVTVGALISLSNSTTPGKVIAIDPEIDTDSRSIEVLVQLPDDYSWRIGQLISLSFQTSVIEGAISVPTKSVVRIGGQEFVFVETQNGFRSVAITTLARSRDELLVDAALVPADKVAVTGLAALKNMTEGV